MTDVSVIIPARNEEFLQQTIDDILSNIRADSEVIVILDGYWTEPGIPQQDRLTIIHHEQSIGQRAAVNEGARLSSANFVMKLDAHCAVDEGFDVKLMADCKEDWTVIPRMYNLHAFDWKCNACGHQVYQGPIPKECAECKKSEGFEKVLVWKPRLNKMSDFMRFDNKMKFNYWSAYAKRPEAQGDVADLLSSIGASFFMRRDRFFELGGMDEAHGSWGQFGTEVACKAWLSGGRHVVNKNTWFAHMFRTNSKGFSFPYPLSGKQVGRARNHSRNLWLNDNWPQATRKLSWLIEKFRPVPDWHSEEEVKAMNEKVGIKSKKRKRKSNKTEKKMDRKKVRHKSADGTIYYTEKEIGAVPTKTNTCEPTKAKQERPPNWRRDGKGAWRAPNKTNYILTKGIVYYTDNRCEERISRVCRQNLKNMGLPIVAVSQYPIDFENNIVMPIERSIYSQARQILAGCEVLDVDVIFLAEHDILYHPCHFDFTPDKKNIFYYNQNRWPVCAKTGQANHYLTKALSHGCADRNLYIEHYKKRVEILAVKGYRSDMGHSPGSRTDNKFGPAGSSTGVWFSEWPNVDLRHATNYTKNRFNLKQFKKTPRNWILADEVPGWGKTKGRFDQWMIETTERIYNDN